MRVSRVQRENVTVADFYTNTILYVTNLITQDFNFKIFGF